LTLIRTDSILISEADLFLLQRFIGQSDIDKFCMARLWTVPYAYSQSPSNATHATPGLVYYSSASGTDEAKNTQQTQHTQLTQAKLCLFCVSSIASNGK